MNYFSPKETAERYKNGRPDFHRKTILKVKDFLKIENKLEKALDIACGTGLSTKALLEIADNIYGTDASNEMLRNAFQNKNIIYQTATAEQQPFSSNEFDIITVCSGVHWFDIDKFLIETNRLLKKNCWLVLYENYFLSEMENVGEFRNWFPEVYLKKFPSPTRNNSYEWLNDNLKTKKFSFIKEENFKNTIEFTKEELILYFTTQSNITVKIESEETTYLEIENWLDKELSQFFLTQKRKINYGNWIKYLQK
jgi:ubiquinone/menaquinone biosynthesis C-methylase UbiE